MYTGERVASGTGESLTDIVARAKLPITIRYAPDHCEFVVVWRDRDGRVSCDSRRTNAGASRVYRDVVLDLQPGACTPPVALAAVDAETSLPVSAASFSVPPC